MNLISELKKTEAKLSAEQRRYHQQTNDILHLGGFMLPHFDSGTDGNYMVKNF